MKKICESTISKNGQTTVKQKVLAILNTEAGDTLEWMRYKDGKVIVQKRRKQL